MSQRAYSAGVEVCGGAYGRAGEWAIRVPSAICHGMAKQNSPGLQPWVRSEHKIAVKVATDEGERLTGVAILKTTHYGMSWVDAIHFGRHFQGASPIGLTQG